MKKRVHRSLFMGEMFDPDLAPRADTSPSPRQTGISKQTSGNLERIKSRHVPVGVLPLDVEVIGLLKHGDRFASGSLLVQREF
ncbi:hypothetical protein FHT97_006211 [Rhizobium sp. BK399]|nr:hypothetical protein [Rhizobium sp. BK181]MBB3545441.1 hypothetical protein [Rhizobium sp. BK399]MCS3742215.1 hypothetical protein [Rhizobium sp. BK661]